MAGGRAGFTQGRESSAPRGKTCVYPVHTTRGSSSCARRREASELMQKRMGEGLGESAVYPGASNGPAATATVNQIYCR